MGGGCKWTRLPRTYDEIFARAGGKPDPLAGYGVIPTHDHDQRVPS